MPFSSRLRRATAPPVRAFSLFLLSGVCSRALPIISQHPQAATVVAGQIASFSVTATGTTALTYQWRRDGFAIPGATASFFVLPASSQGDAGVYDVRISDGQGLVDSAGAMLRVSPVRQPDAVVFDPAKSAKLESPENGTISSVAVLPDGRFYVIGSFTSIDNQPRDGLARFNADATLDRSFSPVVIDGPIRNIAAYPDGRLIIAGNFSTVDGAQSVGLARLNVDGSRDAAFAVGTGLSVAPGQTSASVEGIAAAPDGGVFLAGNFYGGYQGVTVPSLFKLTGTGARDTNFSVSTTLTEASGQILLAPDGKIYAAGAAYRNNGVRISPPVVRFLPNGAVDPAFDSGSDNFSIRALFRQSDGKILFSSLGTDSKGVLRSLVVRLNDNGAVDSTFNLTLSTNQDVAAIDQFSNGDLLVSGFFNGTPAVARIKPDGTNDRSVTPPAYGRVDLAKVLPSGRILVGGTSLAQSGTNQAGIEILEATGRRTAQIPAQLYPGSIQMMGLQPGGKLIVAGNFTYWNGTPVPRIARLNADFSLDQTFRPGTGPDGSINTGAIQPDGKILLLGFFTRINGTTANRIARLNADGSLDPTFRGSLLPGVIASVPPVVLRDGRIFLPIAFDSQGTRGFKLFNPDGSIPATDGFGSGTGSPGNLIYGATVLPDGRLLVGGYFDTWNGQPKRRLIRLNADGSLDETWSVDPTKVTAINFFDSNNRVQQSTGGMVIPINGTRSTLGRLDTNGAVDPNFVWNLPSIFVLNRYLIQSDDRIIVWGYQLSDASHSYMARVTATGAPDASFQVLGPNYIGSLATTWGRALITDTGDIVATAYGLFLRYASATLPIITTQPVSLTAAAGTSTTFSVSAVGPGPLAYQWLFNGEPIASATSATYTVPLVLPALAGKYSVTVTNANGATTSSAANLVVDISASSTARLSNVSVRSRLTGTPLIVGFTVVSGSRNLLIRSVGPTLGQFGVNGAAADPRLTLFQGAALIQQNDNWGGAASLVTAAASVSAFPFPATSLDAALVSDVQGSYTGHFDAATSSGVVLAEIYDVSPDRTGPGRITNLSARYRVGTNEDILIAGFSVSGSGVKGVLLRGVGPSLAQFGVSGVLADPQLAVFSGVQQIAENNNWGGSAALTASASSVGAFALPTASLDSALVIYVPAGSYTVQLSGVNGTTGEGLIEIYELP